MRSTGRQRLATTKLGVLGLDRVQRDQGGVGDALGQSDAVAGALVEGDADHDAVADDEGWQIAAFDVGECGRDALSLLGERLSAREGEVGAPLDEAREAVRIFGLHVEEQPVGPVAGIGLHQASVLARGQPEALGDDVGGFAGAQQR